MQSEIKIHSGAGLLLFALILCLLVPSLRIAMGPHGHKADYHRRGLVTFPEPRDLRDKPEFYFQQVQGWHTDRVGFAIFSGRMRRSFSFHVFQDSPVPNVMRGHEGTVYLTAHASASDLSSVEHSCPEIQSWPEIVETASADWRVIQSRFEAEGLPANLLIFPSKKVLYPEHLPRRIPKAIRERCREMRDQNSPIMRLSETFPDTVLDAYPALEPHKINPHFYPPENFHADGEAASRGVDAIAVQMLGSDASLLSDVQFQPIVSNSDLSRILGFSLPNRQSRQIGYDHSQLQIDLTYEGEVADILGGPGWAKRYRNDAAVRDEKVILIANSFGIRAAPYFARYFSHVDIVSTNRLKTEADHALYFEQLVFARDYDRAVFVLHDQSVFNARLGKYANGVVEER